MQLKTVVFLGAKKIGYDCLHHLISQQGDLHFQLTAVLGSPAKRSGVVQDVQALALSAGIPVLNHLDEVPPCDFLISVQYHEILRASHLKQAKELAVNLHMAPLPEYRGCNQFTMAILEDRSLFGATLHCMDEGVDHGDILFEKRFPLKKGIWVDELYNETEQVSFFLFRESLPAMLEGAYTPIPQESLIASRGCSVHYRKDIQSLKVLSPDWPAEKIFRYVRATSMPGFEPPYFRDGDEKIYLSRQWG